MLLLGLQKTYIQKGQKQTLWARTSLSRLTTGRLGRLLTYRKPGLNQAGHGQGSAPSPPPGQPCNLILSTLVSLSQVHSHLPAQLWPDCQEARCLSWAFFQISMAKPAAGCSEDSGVHGSGMLWALCPGPPTLILNLHLQGYPSVPVTLGTRSLPSALHTTAVSSSF